MSKADFYNTIRPGFRKGISESAFDGIESLLAETAKLPIAYRAYLLATTQWETDHTMQPIYEYGPKSYFNKYEPGTRIGKNLGNTIKGDGYRYRGAGYVMITGRSNYKRAGQKLGVDLINKPELATRPDIAAKILIAGCTEGWFTGVKLGDHLDKSPPDYVEARRVVNGTDKAATIAAMAKTYERALRLWTEPQDGPEPAPAPEPAPEPTPVIIDLPAVDVPDAPNPPSVLSAILALWSAIFRR